MDSGGYIYICIAGPFSYSWEAFARYGTCTVPESSWQRWHCRKLDCFKSVATGKKQDVTSGWAWVLGAQFLRGREMHVRTCIAGPFSYSWEAFARYGTCTVPESSWQRWDCRKLDCFKSVATGKKQDVTSTFKEGQHPECEQVHKRGQETGCSMSVEYKTAADLILCLQVSGSRVIIESAAISWR